MKTSQAKRRSIGARQNPEAEAAILDAATRLLAEKGLKGMTTDAIAREARASKTTLYRWWPTRGALLLAVYMRMKGDRVYADTGSLPGDLAETYKRLFAYWSGEGHVFALIIAEAQHDPALAGDLQTFLEERIAEWQVVLGRAVKRGELRPDADLTTIAESIIAHAWFYLLTDRMDADTDKLASEVIPPWLRTTGV